MRIQSPNGASFHNTFESTITMDFPADLTPVQIGCCVGAVFWLQFLPVYFNAEEFLKMGNRNKDTSPTKTEVHLTYNLIILDGLLGLICALAATDHSASRLVCLAHLPAALFGLRYNFVVAPNISEQTDRSLHYDRFLWILCLIVCLVSLRFDALQEAAGATSKV